jgi:hypothetical protein
VRTFRSVGISLAALLLLFAGFASAQTATTGVISGSVLDSTGAAVPGATVELAGKATNLSLKQTTNQSGQYTMPNIPPGEYELRATAQGFRTTTIPNFKVEVAKAYQQNFSLEVGQITETVAVTAEARAELQTIDSSVGNVITAKSLPYLPTFTRQVNELLTLQPGATPAGEVTGARRDQSTFTLDGIDVTNQSVGGLTTYMYLGVEGVEEFRVGVANPNSSFGRGSGGQVSLVGRRGSNDFHGAAFWYHQNDNFNANTWDRNRIGLRKPELKDNRFGGRIGGPIWKDKAFFFYNQEGRRFPRTSTINRIVPTPTLRQGILQFRDATGAINSYNLRTSTACGAAGNAACDPRGLGLSPSINQLWNLLPAGNDPTQGDGLNTIGFTGIVGHPITDDFYLGRIDYNVSQNWRFDSSFRYYRIADQNNGSLNISNGNVSSIRSFPNRQNLISLGLTGAIKPNLTAEFRFGWNRTRPTTDVIRPNASAGILNIAGTSTPNGPIALDVGALGGAQSILSEPFDVDTQLARKQINDNRTWQYGADLNWIKGKHTVQFGGKVRYLPTFHGRDDKVLGSLGSLVAQIDSTLGSLQLPQSIAPPPCSATRTTGCLQASDLQTWNRLYAGVTGLIDNVSVLGTRDGQFQPLPFGDLLISDTFRLWAPEFYVQDVWKITPSLTITAGINYGWQNPPRERLGRYTIQQIAGGEDATSDTFFDRRRAGALSGQVFNPEFQFNPVNNVGRDVFNVDYNNLAPRVAIAWNPGGFGGPLGWFLGDKKTVIRGGYSLVFDRQNTVQSVIIPSLGVAFAQTLNVNTPLCNSTGAGGAGCVGSSTNSAVNGFRVGVDGTIPRPTVPPQSVPVNLQWGQLVNGVPRLFPEVLSFQVDPNIQVGENHAIDFTIQRELPLDHLIEVSFVGRYASKLPQSMNLVQPIYMHVDRASGQSFAQAYDNVAVAIRRNQTVANQAWFENNMPGGTAALVASQRTNLLNGNLNSVFLAIDRARLTNGLPSFNNYYSQMSLLRSSTGSSNYNGMLLSLRKRFTKGFLYDFSYTFSKSLDQLGEWQNSASVTPDSFDLDREYGPSLFDITHAMNLYGSWDLPFRTGNRVMDYAVKGWNLSGVFTAQSGLPLTFVQGSQVWGGSLFLGFNSGMIPLAGADLTGSVNRNVAGSNNFGTNGNPATRGSGLNLFANPEQVFNSFRQVEVSRDGRAGRANPIRGLGRWNADISIAKTTKIGERVSVRFSLDAFNVFNNILFANPGQQQTPALSFTNPRAFGVLTQQFIPANRVDGARWLQTGIRVEF